ncbi:uncharacterized protein N7484_008185 [Penicillium longicatenatum]|uniref:uncharacterized protein n=1 Tax=Penicillium longicatenatum TaxID=1561947 RepID=UPI002549A9F8|nr:uncharacterized protein N7484_008185 [Penicillium longicatenatum]KAJ5640323.1 hypothetical protein N7484_008185 [Penicillium longicatenatum]
MARVTPKHSCRLSHATIKSPDLPLGGLRPRASTVSQRKTLSEDSRSTDTARLSQGQRVCPAGGALKRRDKAFERLKAQKNELATTNKRFEEDLQRTERQLKFTERRLEIVRVENESLRDFLREVFDETRALESRIRDLIVAYSSPQGRGKLLLVRKGYGTHKKPESPISDPPADYIYPEAGVEEGPNC